MELTTSEINNIIINRKVGFMEQQLLTPVQDQINKAMLELDLVAHRMEIKWGVGRLYELAAPELREKWDRQRARLNDAIIDGDLAVVDGLIQGSIRGWGALEAAAVAAGHAPYEPLYYEIDTGNGAVYRVVRHMEDAHSLKTSAERPVVALVELVRVYHLRLQDAFKTPVMASNELVDSGRLMDGSLPF